MQLPASWVTNVSINCCCIFWQVFMSQVRTGHRPGCRGGRFEVADFICTLLQVRVGQWRTGLVCLWGAWSQVLSLARAAANNDVL